MKTYILHEAYLLIHPTRRRKGLGVVLLLMVSSLLDFFSLAFFLPLIFLLTDPETLKSHPYFIQASDFFGFTSISSFAIPLTMAVFVFIVLKTQINIWITKRKAAYAYSLGTQMATLAVDRYMRLPYLQFIQAKLSHEINLISSLPLVFANNIVIPAGTLLAEALVFLLLLGAVAVYDFKVFAFLFWISVPAFIIYRLRRKKIKILGHATRKAYPLLLKYALQIVEGLADIRAFRKESFFKRKFRKASRDIGKIFSADHAAHTSTARTTEIIAAGCVCTIIIYTLLSQRDHVETLKLLSIYAGVSFRIIPSINRILAAIHQIKVHEYSVREFRRMLSDQKNTPADNKSAITFSEQITLENICFGYPGQSRILNNINFTIRKGEKIAFIGKSGSGKTSLFLILLRFLQEQEGQIQVDGKPLKEHAWAGWRKLLGYVPQNPYIIDGSIIENIAFGINDEQVDREKTDRLIRETDLADWIALLPDGVHTRIGEKGTKISGGQRQRLAIARALYHDAEILLLDEATNQLDSQTEKEVISTLLNISDRNKTIVMITHHPTLLKKFDAIYELVDGKLKKAGENVFQSASLL